MTDGFRIIRPASIDDAALLSSNVPENDYAAWNAGTTYALADRALYVIADTHWIIESLQASNTGHTPTGESTDAWWLVVGSTNRWRMFDSVIGNPTTNAESIAVSVSVPSRVDSIGFFNVDAATLTVTMTDVTDGVVYSNTVNLSSTMGITDWYAYFYEPIVRFPDYALTDLPPYSNAEIAITLSGSGTVTCGECVIGLGRLFGSTEYGAKFGIQDYSIKQRDDFGNYSVLERAYNKFAQFNVLVENELIDQMAVILAQYRATPIVYIGSTQYSSTMIYGFAKDWSTVIAYPNHSYLSIEVEGLT